MYLLQLLTTVLLASHNTSLVQELLKSNEVKVNHTSRTAAPEFTEKAVVPGYDAFAASRYAVTFSDGKGATKHVILQTEGKVDHFHPVVPGKTKVNGYVAETTEPMTGTEKAKLTSAEVLSLLKGLRKNWGKPSEITDPDKKITLLALSAIYSNGDKKKLEKAVGK